MASALPRRLRGATAAPTSRVCALRGLTPVAKLGDPADLRPGNLVLALARLDEGGARAAFGAVSATGGKWRAWKGGEIDRWLQSDPHHLPGFGGARLVDATGRFTASTRGR